MESTNFGQDEATLRSRSVGGRTEIATFDTYGDAQDAVERLSDAGFAVEHLSIVADGLRFVEHLTGRHGYKQAVLGGARSGAWLGAMFGFFFGLFDWVDPLVSGLALAVYGLVLGVVAGTVVGAVSHGATLGRRDFSSVAAMQADRYVVLCDSAEAEHAHSLLTGSDHA